MAHNVCPRCGFNMSKPKTEHAPFVPRSVEYNPRYPITKPPMTKARRLTRKEADMVQYTYSADIPLRIKHWSGTTKNNRFIAKILKIYSAYAQDARYETSWKQYTRNESDQWVKILIRKL